MDKLDVLEEKKKQLEGELFIVKASIRKEQLISAEQRYGVKIGSIVVYRGKDYKVMEVDTKFWSSARKPWLVGNPRRKDGAFGVARRQLYPDWELKS